ncbi:antibiotic biosynthesis monooxygenase [Lentzea sp. NPDC051838]|uniref:antibiotic biosynthesis monooxygenase n=1 Tax=Lentzea sp. NPDC051838 TaxID=3154849 RepID=UPI00341DC8C3
MCRFRVSDPETFTERVKRALELLTAQKGCHKGTLARSTDEDDRWVLTVEFESVVAYRRAMSPFPVREHVIPLLSEALTDEPAMYEPTLTSAGGEVEEHTSVLAEDAFTVRLGEAAGPTNPRR